jgi:hypothetical protein
MSDDPIVCTPDEIVGPAIDELVSLRPAALQHINTGLGVYSHPIAGWRAQASLALKRLALAAADRRLALANGQALIDTATSEFAVLDSFDPTAAVGEVSLSRATLTPGTIPKGTRFKRPASLLPPIPLSGAEYTSTDDVTVARNQLTVTVKIQAVTTGAASNTPLTSSTLPSDIEISDTLFDTFTVTGYSAAGGSDIVTNGDLKHFATAFSRGQYAPTSGALAAGALKNTGVKRFGVYDDTTTGTATVFVADKSWASGSRWVSTIKQSLYDNEFVGFGCKVTVGIVLNTVVVVTATVMLKDNTFLNETSSIDRNIKAAIRRYLDDRSDWYVWKSVGLRAAITRADSRILKCSSAVMTNLAGAVIPETTGNPLSSTYAYHYYIPDNNVTVNYVSPV